MTIEHKTPMARKAARSYCRRCLAVMLCCVLVFSLTVRTAPRAQAVVAAPAIAAGAGVISAPVGATLGILALCAAGGLAFNFSNNTPDVTLSHEMQIGMNRGYDMGYALDDYLMAHPDLASHWSTLVDDFKSKGGVAAGASFTLSAALAEGIRAWAHDLHLTDGEVIYNDRALFDGLGEYYVFSEADTTELDAYIGNSKNFNPSVGRLGSFVFWPSWNIESNFTDTVDIGLGIKFHYEYSFEQVSETEYKYSISLKTNMYSGKLLEWNDKALYATSGTVNSLEKLQERVAEARSSFPILIYSAEARRIYSGRYYSEKNFVTLNSTRYYSLAATEAPAEVTTSITESSATYKPVTQDVAVTVPANATSFSMINGYAVPILNELSPDVVLNPGADVPDVPIEGDVTWDNVKAWLENWAAHSVPDVIGGAVGEAVDKAVGNAVPQAVADALAQTAPDVIAGALPGAVDKVLPGAVQNALTDALPGALDKAVDQALPITGTKAGDQVMEEVAQDPDSLGAVFISKFPFSIPWDIYKAVKLLAAPPVTPRWEIDFFGPYADTFGGFGGGDTAIVLDFGQVPLVGVITRWTSTIMFVYALATATKRYIWTA